MILFVAARVVRAICMVLPEKSTLRFNVDEGTVTKTVGVSALLLSHISFLRLT